MVVRHLPSPPSPTFVLSVPDFDSQNIMVDDQGNLTGIIDWDLAQNYAPVRKLCSVSRMDHARLGPAHVWLAQVKSRKLTRGA